MIHSHVGKIEILFINRIYYSIKDFVSSGAYNHIFFKLFSGVKIIDG